MMPGSALMQDEMLTSGVLTRRVAGWVADLVILAMLGSALAAFLVAFGVLTFGLGFHLWPLLGLLPFAYSFLSLVSPLSATPGQALAGLAVRNNADLGRPDLLQAVLSTIGYTVTMAAGVIWLAFALISTRHRALHDMVSGLVVVRRRALWAPAMWTAPPGWSRP